MTVLKTGVIGLGVGKNHVRTIERHSGAEVVALCDLDKEHAGWRPNYRFHTSSEQLIDDSALDLVVVASYDDVHCDQVVSALDAGKHVFAEKPLCLTEQEFEAIVDAMKRNPGCQLSANHVLRTCPLFLNVKDRMASGEVGRIYHLEADYYWGRSEKLTNGWRANMPFYSIIHGAAIHMIDLVMWLTGKRPVAVSGVGSAIALPGSGFRYNDFAVLILEFDNGLTAKVSAHGGCAHPHHHRLAVYGTKKTFTNNYDSIGWIQSSTPDTPLVPDESDYPAKAKRSEALASFVDSILDPATPPLIPSNDVIDCMAVCLAAEQAVASGIKKRINYR